MTNDKFYLVDTNVWISNLEELKTFDNLVVTGAVLRELDKLKSSQNQQLAFDSRKATRFIKENKDKFKFDLMDYDAELILGKNYDNGYADNRIVAQAFVNEYGVISNDINVQFKALGLNLEVRELGETTSNIEENKGFVSICVDEETHIENLITEVENSYNLEINQYAIINDSNNDLLDIVKWDGISTVSLKNADGTLGQQIKSGHFGTFIPRDEQQIMAVDSIYNNQVTMLRGIAGTGKSLLALSTAWNLVEQEGYKLVIFTNPENVKDSTNLGYYKGTKLEKLLQSVGTIIPKFGDEMIIEQFIMEGKLEIQALANLRGYDTGDSKVIVWIIESQNMSVQHMQLAGQRISENTKLIIDGDYNTQIDNSVFERNNGMKRLSSVLRGEDLYGEIELQTVYRSRLAKLLDKM